MSYETVIQIIVGVVGGLITVLLGIIGWVFLDLVSQVRALATSASENTSQIRLLVEQVSGLATENASLRKSHRVLTEWLIRKGILPPAPPTLEL